jgi:GNAT superfamily N-acetyltransferase
MFKDMGILREDSYDDLARATMAYLAEAMPKGEYVAWVVTPEDSPEMIVAGGGVQLRRILPRPDRNGGLQKPWPQALAVNVFTEKEWRRRGLAEMIMRTMIAWCKEYGVASLVLHPSDMAYPLYEKLGFETSKEMYYRPFVTGEDE